MDYIQEVIFLGFPCLRCRKRTESFIHFSIHFFYSFLEHSRCLQRPFQPQLNREERATSLRLDNSFFLCLIPKMNSKNIIS